MEVKMKKRIVSLVLSALLFAGSLASCATVPETDDFSDAVTLASSDAGKYAEWLTDRLGTVPHDVVMGIGDSAAYGVDMSDFEDDGYIIRTFDEKTLIFGKTADGLDRGVRKYAIATERGEDISNVTYHEGYRIEEFKIFGVDISEYVIEYDDATANGNMRFATTELQQLVRKACGAELAISETATDAPHKIILRHSTDEELRLDGFRYFAENGNLVIEGAVDRGCMHGVYRFLQNECGWENLDNLDSVRQTIGDSYLNEADLIDVPADINVMQVPSVDFVQVHTNRWDRNGGTTDRIYADDAQISYGTINHACHGMQGYMWDDHYHDVHSAQACYTKEDELDNMLNNITIYLENQIAAGVTLGDRLRVIDISQGDNNRYCMCKYCSEVMTEYKSISSTVVYGANYLAKTINEMYPTKEGIAFQIFAYFASKIPPENNMEISDYVYITFAQNGNCSNHPMDGSECDGVDENWNDAYLVSDDNVTHDEWLRGWCELSDNVYVWNYALDKVLQQYTILDVLLQDFKYMKEIGVKGLFWQNTYHGFGIKRVEHVLGMDVIWDTDMTEEEFEAKLCRLLEREYGSGWAYVREYIDLWSEAVNRIGCYNCWGYGSNGHPSYDTAYIREHGDTMLELIEKAISLADDARTEYRIRLLSCHVYYEYILSHYFVAYEAEDAEMLEALDQMYLDTIELIKEMGFDLTAVVSVDGGTTKIYPTLEQEAWLVWVDNRSEILGISENLRPAPEVEDIYAEPAA